MMNKKQQLTQRLVRPGEGVVIGVSNPSVNGANSKSVSIDLSSAQVPDRRYAAEVGTAVMSANMVRLLFGQTKPIGNGLSSLLVIHISYRAARAFMNSMDGLVGIARTYMGRFNIKDSPLFSLDNQAEPAQTATVEANVIVAAFSGREACMDFYHSSSFAMRDFGISGRFVAEPMVRVTLGLPLLIAIYDWLESHKSELPADELEGEL